MERDPVFPNNIPAYALEPTDPKLKVLAQRVVCSNAKSIEDASYLLSALGIKEPLA